MTTRSLNTIFLIALLLAVAIGCDREEPAPAPPQVATSVPATRTVQPSTDGQPRVAFLGDSLTAGYGLEAEQAFPTILGQLLDRDALPIHVLNAGVSGDTTAGGLRRIDWVLRQKPDIVVIGLGGNDGLRALPPAESQENLRKIVQKSREAGASVLLLGMLIPPNYGPEYVAQFREVYPTLAKDLSVPLVPFLLEGVGGDPKLNLPDGIHPTAEGHQRIARTVLPYLKPLVEQKRKSQAGVTTRPAAVE